jgi:hypothetical protein
MKSIRALFAAVIVGCTAWAQPIPLEELLRPNNTLRDPVFGVAATYPKDWQVGDAARWGKNNLENTIFFVAAKPMKSRPSLYYQPRSNFDSPQPGQELAHFRYTAGTKEQQRIRSGLSDYRNVEDSFHFSKINGRPAFSYSAVFSRAGQTHFEYFTRVLGEKMMVMFFVQGPIEELDTMRRATDQMAATIQVP